MQQNAPFCVLLKKKSIFTWFYHTNFIYSSDYTDFIYKMQQSAPFCVLKKKISERGGRVANPLPLLVSRGLACMLHYQNSVSFKGQFGLFFFVIDFLITPNVMKGIISILAKNEY